MPTSTVVRVDPKTLLVGPNVRREVTLRPEFVASITEHGVIVPILAQESADGLEVVDGQMRTLAAVDAGLADVPVFVRPPVADEASRIVEQIVVNEDRAGLTAPDHVAAIAQLALDFKVPAAEIARRTGASKDDVAHIVTVSKSKPAIATIGQEGVTLELAAKMAEAELTDDEIREVVGYSWNKDQALRQVLSTRARNAETERLIGKLQGDGVAIATKPSTGEYNAPEKNKHRYLGDLVDAKSGKKVTTANHKSCPGHAAFVGVRGYNGAVEVHYLCTDPSKYGHRDANRAAPVKLTDEERAQKQLEKERAATWIDTTAVRREWIREQLLTRKALPAGWDVLVLHDLVERHATSWEWAPLALELVGKPKADDDWYPKRTLAEWAAERPVNGSRAALAAVIARHEAAIGGRNDWSKTSTEYLTLLASWGYELGESEQGILDARAGEAAAA